VSRIPAWIAAALMGLGALSSGCEGPSARGSDPEVAEHAPRPSPLAHRSGGPAAPGLNPIAVLEHPSDVVSISLSPDGEALISGDREGTLRVWERSRSAPGEALEGRLLGRLAYEAHQVAWVAGTGLALAEGLDSTLWLWDARSGEQLRAFERAAPPALFAPSADGARLATVGAGRIRVREIASGRELRSLPAHEHFTTALAFSPDGASLASGGDRGVILLRDIASGGERLRLAHPESSVSRLAFSPDGRLLATLGLGGGAPLRLWDAATGERVDELRAPGAGVETAAFSPDGRLLAAAASDRRIHLWKLPSRRRVGSFAIGPGNPRDLAIGPRGRLFVAVGERVSVWDLATLPDGEPDPSELAVVQLAADPATGVTHVRDAGELLGSIASGRTLELAPGTYDLSRVRWRDLAHVAWRRVADGEEIVVHDLVDLTLRGHPQQPTAIVAGPRDADVLSFERVEGLRLENLELRHAHRDDACSGAALSLLDATHVTVSRCRLLGSGREGLSLARVKHLRFRDSEIRECTSSVMSATSSQDLVFESSRFAHNGALFGPAFRFEHSRGVRFGRVSIEANTASGSLFSLRSSAAVEIAESEILGNRADRLVDAPDGVRTARTRFSDNGFAAPLPSGSRFATLDVAIGAAFHREGVVSVSNSLFSGCDERQIEVGDVADVVDAGGLLCRARVVDVSGDGCLLNALAETCREPPAAPSPSGAVDVFLVYPSDPSRIGSQVTVLPDLRALEADLPPEVRRRLETSRAAQGEFGIDSVGDVDGDGSLDLVAVAHACRPGSEFTCHSVLVREDGGWREAKRIGHP
jgi:WD40 repeat protein